MSDHTSEPWAVDTVNLRLQHTHRSLPESWRAPIIPEGGGNSIAEVYGGHGDGSNKDRVQANARRIVACVNACEGIPTEALQDGTLADAIALLYNIKDLADRGNVKPPKPIWDELERILDRLKDGDA